MYGNKRVVAIIPARGGSKRLPMKNILDFHGKPLIAWTIDCAKQSKYVDLVLVSTDDIEIANISIGYGASIPSLRPEYLATDTATTNDVIIHVLDEIVDDVDIVVVLQPTSPLRSVEDVDQCIELFDSKNAEGIVSITECEHSPLWSNILPDDGNLEGFLRPDTSRRSQDLPQFYRLNGAVYCFSVKSIRENDGIKLKKNVYAYIMSKVNSVDIDDQFDFDFAMFLAKKLSR